MSRGRRKRSVPQKIEVTPKKIRSNLIPLTPRIHLVNLDLNKIVENNKCQSFIIQNWDTTQNKQEDIHITPSPQSKRQVSRSLKFDSYDDELEEPFSSSGLMNLDLNNIVENDTCQPFIIQNLVTTQSKQEDITPSPESKRQVRRSLKFDSYDDELEEPYLSSGSEYLPESNTSNSSYSDNEITPIGEIFEDQNSINNKSKLDYWNLNEEVQDISNNLSTTPNGPEKIHNSSSSQSTKQTKRLLNFDTNDKESRELYLSSENNVLLQSHPVSNAACDSDFNDEEPTTLIKDISSAKSSDVDSTVVPAKTKTCKKQACLFCFELVVQLPRHFKRKHSDQPIVQKMMASNNNEDKQKILTQLRKQGNFAYNSRVLETGKGQLIVKRRPEIHPKLSTEFLPCSNCLAFYTKNALFRHMKYCDVNKKKWSRVQANSSKLLPVSKYASAALKENVLSIMNTDNITLAVKGDDLILKFGSNLCEKFSAADEKHLCTYVSQKMRELGRLVLAVERQNGKHLSLSELIDPKYLDLIVECTKIIANYNCDTGLYKNPSIAQKLGFSLTQCSSILKACAIRCDNDILRKRCDDFSYLFRNEWNVRIGRHAKSSLDKSRYNKPTLLPVAQDIKTLNTYLTENECRLSSELLLKFSHEIWTELSEIILTKLILFNRRRTGEVNRLSIDNFNNRSKTVDKSDIFASLTEVEKTLTKRFTYVELRGKRGRKVPLLMPRSTESNILLILRFRNLAGTPDTNPYVFGKLNDTSHFDGCAAFRKIVQKCNLIRPECLRSTILRKHVATMSQVMCLREHEMDSLANFMGHDPKIHRQFYKLPDASIHLAKISKVLIAMESGNVESYKGKNFENINIEIEDCAKNTSDNDSNTEENTMCENRVDNITNENKNIKIETKRILWSSLEIAAIKRHLSYFLQSREVPGKDDCVKCIKMEPELRNRTWRHIKYWVYNYLKKNKQNH